VRPRSWSAYVVHPKGVGSQLGRASGSARRARMTVGDAGHCHRGSDPRGRAAGRCGG
jgi:hypothetical protein